MTNINKESADNTTSKNPIVFVKEVAKYFMDFLETDFHKRRFPKRSIKLQNEDNLHLGLNLSKYPTFYKLAWKYINRAFDKNMVKNIDKGAHRTNIPNNLLGLIKLQISKLKKDALDKVVSKIGADVESNAVLFKDDLNKALTVIFDNASKAIFQDLVLPFVNNLIKPLEALEAGDVDTIYLMEEELTAVLVRMLEDKIIQLTKELISAGQPKIIPSLNSVFSLKEIKSKITDFFENFKVNDMFAELFDIDRNRGILDKQEFYFYFCDITFNKVKYPIFYIPFNVCKEQETLKIEFDSEVYINKKALEYVAQEYNVNKGSRGKLKTISERIIYLASAKSNFKITIQNILNELVNFFQLDAKINIEDIKRQVAKSLMVRISNSCYFCLFDKSDEALINDYEEMLEKISEGDDELGNGFIALIGDFIHKNPKPFNPEVEKEWDSTNTSDKLVYSSPIPLNSEQRQILIALNKHDCKYITVQGPPGTGKSHTITAIACDAILKNKSVIVLSDKKEALDVVEDKITETMNNVRIDKQFQNPILRLGKSGNTYSQILNTTAIENIKTHCRAVKSGSEGLKERIRKHVNTLKEDIDSEILFYSQIQLREIHELIKLESYYQNKDIVFDFAEIFHTKDAAGEMQEFRNLLLMLKEEFLQMQSNSILSGFLKLNTSSFKESNDFADFLKEILKIRDLSNKLKEFFKQRIENISGFNEFSDETFSRLSDFMAKYEAIKGRYFGFLFKKAKVREIDDEFKKTFPYAKYDNPSKSLKNLKEVLSILQYALELKKELGASATDRIDYLKIIHACFLEPEILAKIEDLIELVEATEDIIAFCKKYPNMAKLNNIRLDRFNTIISNKLVGLEEVEFARQLRLLELKQRITRSFQEIPQIDYVKQTKSLEELVTAEMTYVMDNRVIDFYENNKSTARSLREIIKGKQKFPKKEFEKLKEAFPCILAGIRDYADYIPLERELFDVLIIDEASQVSIAQAFPALLRAKKIVIFGDRKQFSNVKAAHARSDSNREYLTRLRDVFKTHISTDPTEIVRLGKFNIKTSILEFFEFIASYNAQLTKHFRGYKELISYSNKYFYKNSLQVMKIRGKPINEVLKFAAIEHDGKIEPIPNTNLLEIQFIISELNKIKKDKSSITVGIITPHTNQQKLIMDEIRRLKDSDYYFDNLKLKIMTFDTCQGEERDIIFYSMVAVKDMDRLWGVFIKDLRSIDIEEDGAIKAQRLNVGFSRARETMHFVISKPLDEYNGSIGEALRHYSSVLEDAQKERSSEDVDKSSPKEKEVLHWFYQTEFWNKNKNRIDFIPQFKIGQYLKQLDITYTHPDYVVDFLLIYKEPKTKKEHKIVIEYDGFHEHFTNIANVDSYNYREYYTSEDVYRQKILMGYGYKFLRINKFNIGNSPVETLNNRIESLVTGKAEKTDFLQDIHNAVEEIQAGTKRECPRCSSLKDIDDFKDSSLISGISRYCKECKVNKKAQKKPSYTKIHEKNLLLVQQAIKHNRTLDIVYRGRYSSKTYRKIKPLRITGTLVKAYCYLRRSERTFNITRMKIQVP